MEPVGAKTEQVSADDRMVATAALAAQPVSLAALHKATPLAALQLLASSVPSNDEGKPSGVRMPG